jgi:hypothetical protein
MKVYVIGLVALLALAAYDEVAHKGKYRAGFGSMVRSMSVSWFR